MRIAIVSDIHGNLPALEAVAGDVERQSPDEIWCGGDLGWAGPWASECIAFVRDAGWTTVRGNTDVWITGDPQTVTDEDERAAHREYAAMHDISEDDAGWLLALPLGHSGPGSILLVHGTPESPFDAPMPDAPGADFAPYAGAAAVVVYGHIHRAFVRRLADATIVCNAGSVGLPMDGPTASYLLLEMDGADRTFIHRRVTFDRDAALAGGRALGNAVGDRFVEKLQEGAG
ncbi:MAG: metallophosphatase family protein [Actinomycetota bacterium]|nr:metallophosphatase family protein [Actinomycetota bacterium]